MSNSIFISWRCVENNKKWFDDEKTKKFSMMNFVNRGNNNTHHEEVNGVNVVCGLYRADTKTEAEDVLNNLPFYITVLGIIEGTVVETFNESVIRIK